MKIDTQGMSYGTGKGSGKSLEEQRAAIPDVKPKQINIITDALKAELKDEETLNTFICKVCLQLEQQLNSCVQALLLKKA